VRPMRNPFRIDVWLDWRNERGLGEQPGRQIRLDLIHEGRQHFDRHAEDDVLSVDNNSTKDGHHAPILVNEQTTASPGTQNMRVGLVGEGKQTVMIQTDVLAAEMPKLALGVEF